MQAWLCVMLFTLNSLTLFQYGKYLKIFMTQKYQWADLSIRYLCVCSNAMKRKKSLRPSFSSLRKGNTLINNAAAPLVFVWWRCYFQIQEKETSYFIDSLGSWKLTETSFLVTLYISSLITEGFLRSR